MFEKLYTVFICISLREKIIKKALITDVTRQSDLSNDVACIQSHVVANIKMSRKFSYKLKLLGP